MAEINAILSALNIHKSQPSYGALDASTPRVVDLFERKRNGEATGQVGVTNPTVALAPNRLPAPMEPLVDAIAKRLGIEPAVARAILEVESNGKGFTDGRMTIRFEPHVFRKLTGRKVPVDRGRGQKGEWAAFRAALEIDSDAAYRSISMGAGQVMGFNYARIGYASPRQMFQALSARNGGYAAQVRAMFEFIKTDPKLLRAARQKDWATFARLYNGADYAKHNPPYDVRLRRAYERAQRRAA